MEAFVLSIRDADPGAVLALGHGIPDAADIELYTLSLRRHETAAHPPLRVDFRILSDLPVDYRVQRRGLEIFYRRGFVYFNRRPRPPARLRSRTRLHPLGWLRHRRETGQQRKKNERQNCFLHWNLLIRENIAALPGYGHAAYSTPNSNAFHGQGLVLSAHPHG